MMKARMMMERRCYRPVSMAELCEAFKARSLAVPAGGRRGRTGAARQDRDGEGTVDGKAARGTAGRQDVAAVAAE